MAPAKKSGASAPASPSEGPSVTVKKRTTSSKAVTEGPKKTPSFNEWAAKGDGEGRKATRFRMHTGQDVIEANNVKIWVPSGILPLDIALSGGLGLPTGHIMLLSSETSKGKTLLGLLFACAFQAANGIVYLLQREGGMLGSWMLDVGLLPDPESLNQAKNVTTYEEGFAWMEQVILYHNEIHPGRPGMILFDSINALEPGKVFDVNWPDLVKNPEFKARLSSMFLPRLQARIIDSNILLVAISQLRENVDKTGRGVVGEKMRTAGGKGWPFYSSAHIRLKDVSGGEIYPYPPKKGQKGKEWMMKGDRVHEPMGHEVEAYLMKNRLTAPHRKCFLPLISTAGFGHTVGCDNERAMQIWLEDRGFVGKYAGKDKKLKDAGALELALDGVGHPFVDLRGFKELLGQDGMMAAVRQFMLANVTTRGVRDAEFSSGDEPLLLDEPLDGDETIPDDLQEQLESLASGNTEFGKGF